MTLGLPGSLEGRLLLGGVVALVVGLVASGSAEASALGRPSPSRSLAELRAEYLATWDAATIRPERLASVDRVVDVLVSHRARYEAVARATGVPWYVVAVVHSLEGGGSSGRFTGHLHNGDPLTSRTVHVPVGRPTSDPSSGGAYTWEESAVDALSRWRGATDWSLAPTLWRLEGYNGFGTRARGVFTPYLWSFTSAYTRGKYVRDGVWDADAVSAQVGAAALLRRMVERGIITIPR